MKLTWRVKLATEAVHYRVKRDDDSSWRKVAILILNKVPDDSSILDIVAEVTGWSLCAFQSGPGRAFAHEPCIYEPVTICNRHFIKVTWSGGLDI